MRIINYLIGYLLIKPSSIDESKKAENKLLERLVKSSEILGYTVKQGYFNEENKFVFFQKNKTGDLVILVHGLGNNLIYGNQSLVSSFIERDLNVLIFDLDGHGSSKTNSFSYKTIKDALKPAIAFSQEEGDYRVHLVGYSIGAYICARFANLCPEKSELSSSCSSFGPNKPKP